MRPRDSRGLVWSRRGDNGDGRGQAPPLRGNWRGTGLAPTGGFLGTLLLWSGCSQSEAPWFGEESRERGVDFVHHSGFDGRPMMPEMMGGGVALADLDGDGDLDVYLVQSGRVDKTLSAELSANRLYLNRGDGRFDEVGGGAGAGDRGYGMGVAAGDYDNDGDTDLYVTNLGPNVLLQNDGTGSFPRCHRRERSRRPEVEYGRELHRPRS